MKNHLATLPERPFITRHGIFLIAVMLLLSPKTFAQNTFPTTGKVGIGTTSPNSTLTIKQSAQVNDDGTAYSNGLTFINSGNEQGYYMGYRLGGTLSIGAKISGTPNTYRNLFNLDNSGNVGIGITTPSQKLDVAGTIQATGFKLTTGAGANKVLTSDANGVATWQTAPNPAITQNLNLGTYQLVGNGGNSGIAISNNGFVGIGTTSPTLPIDVNGRARIRAGNYQTSGLFFTNAAGNTDNGFIGMSNDNTVSIWGNLVGYGLNMNITTGNVGIGTTAPAQKLDVVGTVRATQFNMPLPSPVQANTQYIPKADANGNLVWTPFRDILSIYNSTWGSNVITNGYKLVGVSTSTKGLSINAGGHVILDSTISASSFRGYYNTRIPDYVFEENYQIKPLEQLEEYIKQNKHLPEIPSDEEYKKRGVIDLDELSILLLKKVEELTLHLIEVNKKVETLSSENILLKQQVANSTYQKK